MYSFIITNIYFVTSVVVLRALQFEFKFPLAGVAMLCGDSFGRKWAPVTNLSIASAIHFRTRVLAMLRLLLRVNNASYRAYSAAATSGAAPAVAKSFAIEQLERDGARILKTVQRRVAERHNLLSQISEDMSCPNDVKFSKQAKEIEPLEQAWHEWERNREVREHGHAGVSHVSYAYGS